MRVTPLCHAVAYKFIKVRIVGCITTTCNTNSTSAYHRTRQLWKGSLSAEQEKVESFGQVIENAWLGRVLLTQVRQQPLIELIDGVQVTALTQDTDHVQIEAMRNGEYIHALKSKLVIAADGRDSFCRQAIG